MQVSGRVSRSLLRDLIEEQDFHFTTGIIGLKYMLEVRTDGPYSAYQPGSPQSPSPAAAAVAKALSARTPGLVLACCQVLGSLGRLDVAVTTLQQRTYPSFGFMLTNEYEPATTVWELWNAHVEGPGMNSRKRAESRHSRDISSP